MPIFVVYYITILDAKRRNS